MTLQQAAKLFEEQNFSAAKAELSRLLGNGMETQQVYELLARVAIGTGCYEEAITRCQQAIMADMRAASGHFYLGLALEKTGKVDEAIQSYTRAAKLAPNHIPPLLNAAKLLMLTNRLEQALPYAIRMCQISPLDKNTWNFYIQLVQNMQSFYAAEKELIEPIKQALEGGIHHNLQAAILRNLHFSDWMLELSKSVKHENYDSLIEQVRSKVIEHEFIKKLQNSLLTILMRRGSVSQIYLELVLTQIRKHLLLNIDIANQQDLRPLLLSFWALGFNNEYVFYIEDEEQAALDKLKSEFDADNPDIVQLALLGSYLPLANEGFAEKLNNWQQDDAEIAALIKEQISNPLDERERIKTIDILSDIEDETTKRVRAQYESAPYPRWNELTKYEPVSLKEYIIRFGNVAQEKADKIPTDTKNILVAGSGTGQHPITLATNLPDYNITTVDISLASLAYAIRKAEEYNISNIKFMQADILNLKELNQQFDMIESIGVLHHMQEPMAGWKILTDILKPGGMMRIGLYSSIARSMISLARDEIKQRKLGDSDDDIRKYRRELMAREYNYQTSKQDDGTKLTPLINKLYAANDFFSLSDCRDLLFHVQEHQFDCLKLKECISELGLEFIGFNLSNRPELENFQKSLSNVDTSRHLEKWHEYEMANPETFNGMYQFWLQKPL